MVTMKKTLDFFTYILVVQRAVELEGFVILQEQQQFNYVLYPAVLSEMSSAFNLDFEVSGIHGYVMMDGVMPALTEITCTFWMRSLDTNNYGTPISYAVESSDNAFLLIDYNG